MTEDADIISTIMARLPNGTRSVHASTQYGMGFIITYNNKIVFRNDSVRHAEREAIALEVNLRIQHKNE
jgi:hypothetical protein